MSGNQFSSTFSITELPPTRDDILDNLETDLRDFLWDRLPKETTFENADKIVQQVYDLIDEAWPFDDQEI